MKLNVIERNITLQLFSFYVLFIFLLFFAGKAFAGDVV